MRYRLCTALLIGITITSLGTYAQSHVQHTLYLVGDAGEPYIETSPLGSVLRGFIEKESGPTTLLYLGDNVYPRGVPGHDGKLLDNAKKVIRIQAGWLGNSDAQGIFIPGNHDWQKGKRKGWQYILNQQALIDSLHDERVQLLPKGGCPGPVEIPLTDNAVLVIIDSQWILHPWDKPVEESSCEVESSLDLAALLEDAYARNGNKRVILAAHHPAVTYGEHGGVYGLKDHLFPLTAVNDDLYIPMPVVGSLYPLYRKYLGNIQDVQHPLYKTYAQSIRQLMATYPGSIMVSGHEHALQHSVIDDSYFIVSGSGSKTTKVKKKGYAQYSESVTGFVKLSIFDDGQVIIHYYRVDEEYPNGREIFSDTLITPKRVFRLDTIFTRSNRGQTVSVNASEQYRAGKGKMKWLGENYRDAWAQKITVPYFDFTSENGVLEIDKKGGGMQTLSLRLVDPTGKEYTLRSVEKYPEKAVPEMLRNTFAQDLVQDQISAAHPYGALVIPPLAEAAGIYHTNPKLVFIPDDPRLGIYRSTFANMLALFEERPDGDWSDKAFFGNSKDIINTSKVLEELEDDNDNAVDQQFVLRSRLFDMFIGDWDRHDDQWRWASFDKDKGELFRPIPRDRDQAFFVNEGILPKVWSRKWALPKFEGFDNTISWPSGLSFNARYFDRTFLTEPSIEDWLVAARELQDAMTDDVIESAIRTWPEEIYRLDGEEIIRKLKARRERLVEYALSHYKFLAKEVDVVGSDKHERFEVTRLDSGDVNVEVYKITTEGEKRKRIYARTFRHYETDEIRLYGRGGQDRFNIHGDVPKSILVRIIGGGDDDVIMDESHVNGIHNKTLFYDKPKSFTFESKGELKDLTSDDPDINEYDRRAFQYDRLAPLVYGNFNPDDGLFIGGGVLYQNHGFGKDPFRQRHLLLASFAPRTHSYSLLYRGDFTDILGKWSGHINADFKIPNFVNNFFGWGNESVFDENIDEQPAINADEAIDYYRFRFEEITVDLQLSRKIGTVSEFSFGPAYQRIEVEEPDDTDRYVYDFAETLPYDLFTEFNSYGGVKWSFNTTMRNENLLTRRGFQFDLEGRSMTSLGSGDQTFSSFNGKLSLFYSPRLQGRVILAMRAGGGISTGEYEFYQAQILDGKTELRGFRKTRFYGDSKFFTNIEARIKLASFRSYIFPASFGILAFHDLGRVWYKDENGIDPTAASGKSDVWHKGWGGGLWFTPFNMTVLSAEFGHSNEGNLFYLRLGFLF